MPSTMELNLSRDSRNEETKSIRLIGLAASLIVNVACSSGPERMFILSIAALAALRSASTLAMSTGFRAGS